MLPLNNLGKRPFTSRTLCTRQQPTALLSLALLIAPWAARAMLRLTLAPAFSGDRNQYKLADVYGRVHCSARSFSLDWKRHHIPCQEPSSTPTAQQRGITGCVPNINIYIYISSHHWTLAQQLMHQTYNFTVAKTDETEPHPSCKSHQPTAIKHSQMPNPQNQTIPLLPSTTCSTAALQTCSPLTSTQKVLYCQFLHWWHILLTQCSWAT